MITAECPDDPAGGCFHQQLLIPQKGIVYRLCYIGFALRRLRSRVVLSLPDFCQPGLRAWPQTEPQDIRYACSVDLGRCFGGSDLKKGFLGPFPFLKLFPILRAVPFTAFPHTEHGVVFLQPHPVPFRTDSSVQFVGPAVQQPRLFGIKPEFLFLVCFDADPGILTFSFQVNDPQRTGFSCIKKAPVFAQCQGCSTREDNVYLFPGHSIAAYHGLFICQPYPFAVFEYRIIHFIETNLRI